MSASIWSPLENGDAYVLKSALLAATGTLLIGTQLDGVSAEERILADKLGDTVSALDIEGFDATGVVDSAPALNAGFARFGAAGGAILIPHGCTPLLDTNLTIPDNCALVGQQGSMGRTFSAPNLNLYKPRISLNRTATIRLNNSSKILDLPIFAKNLQFSSTRAVVNAWTGTAITLVDQTADHTVKGCLILGFEFGVRTSVSATRVDRPRIMLCQIDCTNPIYIENSQDVPYIENCHGWPWVTLESLPEANDAHLKRSGAFIWLKSVASNPNDWGKVTNCFNYGWAVGFRSTAADAVTFLSCSADNPPGTLDGSIGFLIEDFSIEPRLVACQAAGRQTGYQISTVDTNGKVSMTSCNAWECKEDLVKVVNGELSAVNCIFRNTGAVGNGAYLTNTSTKTRFNGCKFIGLSIGIKTDSTAVKVYHADCDFDGTTTWINNPYLAAVSSANPLQIDGYSNFYRVAGTNNFDTIYHPEMYTQKPLVLKFEGVLSIPNTGNIKLAGTFNTTNLDTLTLMSDGTIFYEVARSVNA